MTAHVMYPALDPDRPATLSRRIATDVLRGELGFRGVLVSDDLGMKAVADRYPIDELAVGAIAAGCDHLLIREPAARQQAAFEALVRAAESGAELRARVAESAARVAALKAACTVAMPAPGAMLPSLLGTPAHKALAASFGSARGVGRVALAGRRLMRREAVMVALVAVMTAARLPQARAESVTPVPSQATLESQFLRAEVSTWDLFGVKLSRNGQQVGPRFFSVVPDEAVAGSAAASRHASHARVFHGPGPGFHHGRRGAHRGWPRRALVERRSLD